MKELTYFYLKNCPHCKRASVYIEELMQENENYKEISINRVEEREQEDIANSYDYYYVPTFFMGDTKLAEGALSKEDVKKVFDEALA